MFAAAFFPRAVRSGAGEGDLEQVAALFNASIWLMDLFGADAAHPGLGTVAAELFVPQTGTSHDLNGNPSFFGTIPSLFQWQSQLRVDMDFRRAGSGNPTLVRVPTPPGVPPIRHESPSVAPADGILAVILSNTSPQLAVGVVALLAPDPAGQTAQNELGVSQQRTDNVGIGYDKNNGQRISVRTRTTPEMESGRNAGWIGIRFLLILKPTVTEVRAAIQALRAAGRIGGPLPMHYIPAHVLDGRYAPR